MLTEVYKIPNDRLYATVFEGDKKEGIPASTIALAKWKEFLPEDHIVFGNKKDNFGKWVTLALAVPAAKSMWTAALMKKRKNIPGHTLVNKDHPQVIEIWNNVFIQYSRKRWQPGAAARHHVDTGMGLERLVRVIQGKQSNYDTDLFTGTIGRKWRR